MAPIYRSHASEPRLPSISSLIREKGTQVGSCAWPILLWQKKMDDMSYFFF
jgi:hypothetical protein